ncbi:MAG: hypothetical protein ACI4RN_05495 [Oscillospiraceae bacterium]
MFGKPHKNKNEISSDKKIKLNKLNKTELLWIIRDQQVEIEELKNELEKLRNEESDFNGENNTEDIADEQSTASHSR